MPHELLDTDGEVWSRRADFNPSSISIQLVQIAIPLFCTCGGAFHATATRLKVQPILIIGQVASGSLELSVPASIVGVATDVLEILVTPQEQIQLATLDAAVNSSGHFGDDDVARMFSRKKV